MSHDTRQSESCTRQIGGQHLTPTQRLYGHCINPIKWSYDMRWQMQEIIPGLFLGPYAVAKKTELENLKRAGITHIICVRHQLEASFVKPCFPDYFKYLVLTMSDDCTQNIICTLPVVKEFIDSCFQSQGKVLVHDNSGLCKSAALVIGYVMEALCLTFREAIDHVLLRRFCIAINTNFISQLQEYEAIYKARKDASGYSSFSLMSASLKRKHEETMDVNDSSFPTGPPN